MDAGCYVEEFDYNILAGIPFTLLALHQVKIGVQLPAPRRKVWEQSSRV